MSKPAVRYTVGAALIALTCALSACTGGLVPLLTIQNAPVLGPRGHAPPTRDEVHDAIMRALGGRGWQINKDDSSGITATMISGAHSATMHVQYDERYYSILYVDSSPSLKYNGDEIHRRYNDWVEKLSRSIRSYLMASRWMGGIQVIVSPNGTPPPPPPPPETTPPPPAAAPPPAGAYDAPPPPPPPPAAPRQ